MANFLEVGGVYKVRTGAVSPFIARVADGSVKLKMTEFQEGVRYGTLSGDEFIDTATFETVEDNSVKQLLLSGLYQTEDLESMLERVK